MADVVVNGDFVDRFPGTLSWVVGRAEGPLRHRAVEKQRRIRIAMIVEAGVQRTEANRHMGLQTCLIFEDGNAIGVRALYILLGNGFEYFLDGIDRDVGVELSGYSDV